MRSLSSIIVLLGLTFHLWGQSPHGTDFKINCAACHSSVSWEIEVDTLLFDHDTTAFPLTGQHTLVDCRSCHQTLVFPEANTECISCHTDMHRATVGSDCARCHTSQNWLVDNITELHQDNGFPLLGAHATVSCMDCHTSESTLEFNRIGNECINCHLADFNATTNPNHQDAGFPTNCIECHQVDGFDWSSETVNHDFFPLTKGHEIADCAKCHTSGSFSDTPTDCFACHQMDFDNTANPNHQVANFPTNCTECHTTDVGWMPASFEQHDALFPIYSGAHEGEWMQCTDCHNNSSDYTEFTCVNCHTNPETDEEHDGVSGYAYENTACLACHPTGDADNSFDHDDTNFPLTGAHLNVDCILCHVNGYEGTPTNCAACHTMDFEQTTNPNHNELGLLTDCASCHTTNPEWNPASFDIHDDFYPLNGAHAAIANDCAACHNGDYTNTPNTCFGCHSMDYSQTTDPNHEAAQFPIDCASCHTETAWVPSTFDHDEFYALTGAHDIIADDCVACHNGDYTNTPNTCVGCHTQDHTQSVNPNHPALGIPTDCASCHTTDPGWSPASFDIHNDYYALNGAHAAIANDCAACHNGDYTNTPNTCFGCHSTDYSQTTDPNHEAAQFPIDCASCHTETAWVPSTFDHDEFYALTGAHAVIANDCASCHNDDFTNTPNTCYGCHTLDYSQTTNPNHADSQFPIDCESCHTETAWVPSTFDHDEFFPLTGGHEIIADDCVACHVAGDYTNTPNTCVGCHVQDHTQSVNPNHPALGIPTDCESCHSTEPDWMPASFAIHDDYYTLNGAHAAIANDCASCHNGDYNNTPNTCFGCHNEDYNNTINPNHATAQFSTDCQSCHTESEWIPATFDHDEQYFPIYSGAHEGEWSACVDCHTNPSNYAEVSCITCHANPETDEEHEGVGGYVYENTACLACHPTGDVANVFDHNMTAFPLTGAHVTVNCLDCHSNGYEGTSTDCVSCHTMDYNNSINPNHEVLGLPTDCESCHTTDPGWSPASFEVHDDYYILNGAHAAIANDCAACHNGDYTNTPSTCFGCHTTDYNQTTDPNHEAAQFPIDCESCHTETAWVPSTFDHDQFFPLTGGHEIIADDCVACHNGDYTNTPNTCVGCHTQDHSQSVNPNHTALGIPTDCESCHTTEPDWMPASFAIHDDYYALNGAHAAIANDCASCHNGDYNNTPNTCFGCHNEDYNNTINPNHATAQFSTDCQSCHTESEWIPATFDHDGQYFPIYSGAHEGEWSACVDCHTNPSNYAEVSCITCHANPETDEEHEGVGGYIYENTACLACHPTGDVANVFDHNMTAFPLTGAHVTVNCLDCHTIGYEGTSTDCASCHTMDYNNSINPNHQVLALSTDCASCHTTDPGWSPANFAVHDDYYALNGAHMAIANDCAACHNGDYTNTPNTCFGCHTTDYSQTTDPNHEAAQFPIDCESCHTETAWVPSTFDHDEFFPLTGAHNAIANDCATCHNGDYTNTPNTCVGCHTQDHSQSVNPNHIALGIPTDCESCHTTDPGWSPASFAIHNDYYQLNGAHAAISNDCASCHNGDYNNTPNTCFGCHTADYNQTTNPNHAAAQFPIDCESCHTETAWVPSTFDHDEFFPLTGAHNAIANDCATCHNGDYTNTPNTCVGCHTQDHTQSVNPNHIALGIPTDCESCHTTDPGWSPASFAIHNDYYQLNGAHAAIANDCASCHNGDYNNTPNTCFGCHTADYNQTTNPNHAAAQFPIDCESCHTETAWVPSSFDHDEFYPLTGAHNAIANDCATCHNGDYTNTPNTCVGCHTQDHTQSVNPNHTALGIPTDCESCHTTDPGWSPASFAIHNDYYQLNGAHAAISNDCASCHNGDYNNTPNTCFGCHTADYNQTTNPNHAAAQFPIDCESCHTETAWVPSSFDHDVFYVLNGAHAAIANDCASCHHGDYNNTPNTCIGCHTADYNQTTNPNHATAQFPTNCESCHSETAWVPSSFDHNSFYPFTGAHVAIANDCEACHNGNYTNTPNTCVGCHTQDYSQSVNPNHTSLGIPTDCESCHTTDPGWSPASFAIHNNYYQLNGAHAAIANDCASCHNGDYNNTPNTCFGCHTADYNQTTNPNHAAAQFPVDCESCHTETAWVPSSFDHDVFYVLNGAHAVIANDCASCHHGDYNNTPNTCIGCHTADYNNTTNPNHATAQFPTNCESCHSETAWVPSSFDHNSFYPFTGAHVAIANDCEACHNGNYTNTPNTCVGCHTQDYNQSINPNHTSLGIPTDCESCHTTAIDWMPATFAIHNNYYVLNGAHAAIANDCATCHNGDYNNTPNTCYACHANDYNQTNNPNHQSAGFPTDCTSCHSENAWQPATFDHDGMYFPIYDGKHEGEWNDCVDCHTTPGNFGIFNCLECHEHDDPVDLADIHEDVSGYTYVSNACYACHPNGED